MEIVKLKTYNYNFLMGEVDGEKIYLKSPSWDCNWYWGIGYLGNMNCHYHLSGLNKDKNLYDALKEHFGGTLTINNDDLWTFCELYKTAYSLKETAELLKRGGSNYTNNPHKELIKNIKEVERINTKVLPAIFDSIYFLLYKKNI